MFSYLLPPPICPQIACDLVFLPFSVFLGLGCDIFVLQIGYISFGVEDVIDIITNIVLCTSIDLSVALLVCLQVLLEAFDLINGKREYGVCIHPCMCILQGVDILDTTHFIHCLSLLYTFEVIRND